MLCITSHLPHFSATELALRSLPAVGAEALAVLLALAVVLAAAAVGGAVEGGRPMESAEAAVEEEQREEEQAFSPVLGVECGWGAAPVRLLLRWLRRQAHDLRSWFRFTARPQLHIVVVLQRVLRFSRLLHNFPLGLSLWPFFFSFLFAIFAIRGNPRPRTWTHTHTQAHTGTLTHTRERGCTTNNIGKKKQQPASSDWQSYWQFICETKREICWGSSAAQRCTASALQALLNRVVKSLSVSIRYLAEITLKLLNKLSVVHLLIKYIKECRIYMNNHIKNNIREYF